MNTPSTRRKTIGRYALIASLLGFLVLLFAVVPKQGVDARIAQIQALVGESGTLAEQVRLYRELLELHGAAAQELLSKASLPSDPKSHLINHEAGRYLYETEGDSGIRLCRDSYGYSCYHGLIIESVAERGMAALPSLVTACEGSGGRMHALQCFHGMGHGLVAWVGYGELPEALVRCEAFISKEDSLAREYCYTGAFMENIMGLHLGEPSPDRWYDADDPYYPCADERILAEARPICWSSQSQYTLFYPALKDDIGAASAFCETMGDYADRKICFEGLARQIHVRGNGDVKRMEDACASAGASHVPLCISTIARTLYENGDTAAPFSLCSSLLQENARAFCHARLIEQIPLLKETLAERERECRRIPEREARQQCLEAMRSIQGGADIGALRLVANVLEP